MTILTMRTALDFKQGWTIKTLIQVMGTGVPADKASR
jgi:hypothetical protein